MRAPMADAAGPAPPRSLPGRDARASSRPLSGPPLAAAHRSRAPCRVCGAPLTVHQAVRGGICDEPGCRRVLVLAHAAERRRLREEASRRAVEALRRWAAEHLGGASGDAPSVALLPANEQGTAPVPRRRRRRLREHLQRALAEAARLPRADGAAAVPGDGRAPDPLLAAGCAFCRGHCCGTGGDRAHLEAVHLRRRLDEHPKLRPEALLAAYLAHVPRRSYRRSCIFHAPGGCALPRSLRSDVCNRFVCHGLEDLQAAATRAGDEPLLVAASEGGEVVRLALLEPDAAGLRTLRAPRASGAAPPRVGGTP